MKQADWYFDFISPFAYLQLGMLDEVAKRATITLHPVLLAGILNHFGQKGPAEILGKTAVHLSLRSVVGREPRRAAALSAQSGTPLCVSRVQRAGCRTPPTVEPYPRHWRRRSFALILRGA